MKTIIKKIILLCLICLSLVSCSRVTENNSSVSTKPMTIVTTEVAETIITTDISTIAPFPSKETISATDNISSIKV